MPSNSSSSLAETNTSHVRRTDFSPGVAVVGGRQDEDGTGNDCESSEISTATKMFLR